jgi:NADPH:quinone reductase-like Zn-dependent oxidoreductase
MYSYTLQRTSKENLMTVPQTEAEAMQSIPSTMRAILQDRYGRSDVLQVREVATPILGDDQVLIRAKAASLNIYDHHMTTGTPYLARSVGGWGKPKNPIPGADLAGVVVAVGANVTGLAVGYEVFGEVGYGAFAEYAVADPKRLARIPAGVGFEAAAATPMAGLTALQGLRDHGGLVAGRRVIVNGASGGVGTFAVQIARALGAEVTAVCSTTKLETARSLGAAKVIDYTTSDFTETERGYDLLFDNAGYRPWSETSRVLAEGGINVSVTGPKHALMGPYRNFLVRKLLSTFGSKRFTWFTAAVDKGDLEFLAGLLASGALAPVIERRFPLEGVPEALHYLSQGHAAGKLVIGM